MAPEDSVLVGVINTRRDLDAVLRDCWYRVPVKQMSLPPADGYLAFYLSRTASVETGQSGIYWYAPLKGVELAYRYQLVGTKEHPRAFDRYYRLAIGAPIRKEPPILNSDGRAIAFINTTWDRFCAASVLADLYSKAPIFVDRAD